MAAARPPPASSDRHAGAARRHDGLQRAGGLGPADAVAFAWGLRLWRRLLLRLSTPAGSRARSVRRHDPDPPGCAPGGAFDSRRAAVALDRRLSARAVGAVEAPARRPSGRVSQPRRRSLVAIFWTHASPRRAAGRPDPHST